LSSTPIHFQLSFTVYFTVQFAMAMLVSCQKGTHPVFQTFISHELAHWGATYKTNWLDNPNSKAE